MNKNVVIIGAGGHAKVIADIIIKSGDNVYGFLDDNKKKNEIIIDNYKIIGKIDDCLTLQKNASELYFIIAIGNNYTRKLISEKYDLNYYTAIHPTSTIGMQVQIDKGTVVMANVCVNSNTKIGQHCIINTGAVVEHDNIIDDYVHISPNATLCGTVKIGECTHIGAGTTIINNVGITKECIIGAGAVIVNDVLEKGTYVGVPAKIMKEK